MCRRSFYCVLWLAVAVQAFCSGVVAGQVCPGPAFPTRLYPVGGDALQVELVDVDNDFDLDAVILEENDESVIVYLNDGLGRFVERQDYELEGKPTALALGDLNSDGFPDIAVSIRSGIAMNVLFNSGDGSFGDVVAIGEDYIKSGAMRVALGDLDVDGDLDVVVTNIWNDEVSVYMNLDTGVFAPMQRYAVGDEPVALQLIDVDLDGAIDIMAVNQRSKDVSVLLNNGDGIYNSHRLFDGLDDPRGFATGDFNGDEYPDLVVANQSAAGVSILLNNGKGDFNEPRLVGTYGVQQEVSVGDFDGDGDLDLMMAHSNSDRVGWLRNNGQGAFSMADFYGMADEPMVAKLHDMDLDGDLDIVVSCRNGGRTDVLYNGGGGELVARDRVEVQRYFVSLGIGDLDNDGDPDIAVLDEVNGLSVLENREADGFASLTRYPSSGSGGTVEMADLDNDGDLDLAVAIGNNSDVNVHIRFNLGDGEIDFPHRYGSQSVAPDMELGDLDGDGDVDLVITDVSDERVSVLFNAGDATYEEEVLYPVGVRPDSLSLGDLDGDGDLDIAIASPSSSVGVVLFYNIGNGFFTGRRELDIQGGGKCLEIVDLDRDGDNDIAVGVVGRGVLVLKNDAHGDLTVDGTYFEPESPYDLVVGDFDSDGDVDVATANFQGESSSILLNRGDGSFDEGQLVKLGGRTANMAMSDIDQDGDLDLAYSVEESKLSLLINNGDGVFGRPLVFGVGEGGDALAMGDLDGDHFPEIVLVERDYRQLAVLPNQCAGTVCRVDLNGDGDLDFVDVSIFVGAYFAQEQTADFNGDGVLDCFDVSAFLSSYLQGCVL